MEGGLGIIPISNATTTSVLPEIPVVKDADLFGNATLGFTIDSKRIRVVVVLSDLLGNKYSAVAAYDLSDWSRLFLTQLRLRHCFSGYCFILMDILSLALSGSIFGSQTQERLTIKSYEIISTKA
ncbi:hypothetical protein DCAR_0729465 [Daucus carota subsp. sativus]|uniref:Uncharacterized protein n=1 Tax=Daucus carota subsp. sativus TaxID=79200 RepID=A0A164U873_DAUCS|nr:hypothetical protein DCAR_0729465 [Daucus carota subsp. sativus]